MKAAAKRAGRGAAIAARGGLLGVAAAVLVLLFSPARERPAGAEAPGSLAQTTRIARVPFAVPKDSANLRREREAAGQAVAPVFDWDSTFADATAANLRAWNAGADSVLRNTPPPQIATALANWLRAGGIPPTPGMLALAADSTRRRLLLAASDEAVRELAPPGTLFASFLEPDANVIRVRGLPGGDRLVPVSSLLSAGELRRSAGARLRLGAGSAELQNLLFIRYLRPSLIPNPGETEAARMRARGAVDPIELRVREGDTILAAGVRLGEPELRRLRVYENALVARGLAQPARHPMLLALGRFLYNLLILSLIPLALWLRGRSEFADLRAFSLMALLALAVGVGAAAVTRLDLPVEAIPAPFAVLVVAVLGGGRLALPIALVLALLLMGQPPYFGLAVPFGAAMAGAAATIGVRFARRRTQVWRPIAAITVAYAAVAVTLALLGPGSWHDVVRGTGWGALNAIVCTFLAIGFLPAFESWVGVTTQQTLLELSDTSRPLLRRLQREANGTFQHAINVATLTEAACDAIGAQGLLARVGALYHDVGKLSKPQYFIENQAPGRNPHDKLKPATSAAIVRSHVSDGLRLAERAHVPAAVRTFIAEHHGTQKISFFLDQAGPGADPADFVYPGPKPQSRETAILMMADSVESAAHVLADPTAPRLQQMVERIVDAKIATGQLDECPLTLREIRIIKDQLARVLTGMYHHRIDYPAADAPAPVAAARG